MRSLLATRQQYKCRFSLCAETTKTTSSHWKILFFLIISISIQSHLKPNYAGVICTHTVTHGKDTMAYLTIVFVIDGVSTGELFKEKEKYKNLKQSFLPKFKNVPYNNLTLIVQMIFQS